MFTLVYTEAGTVVLDMTHGWVNVDIHVHMPGSVLDMMTWRDMTTWHDMFDMAQHV